MNGQPIPQAEFGLPGGSGTWGTLFPEALNRPDATVLEYFPEGVNTLRYGHTAPFKLVKIGNARCIVFAMHGWHPNGKAPCDVSTKQVAWVFQQAGVKKVLLAASVGGIQSPAEPGIPLPPWSVGTTTDIISPWAEHTPGNPFTEGTRYPRMAEPTCPRLRDALYNAAKKQPRFVAVYDSGIYAGTDNGRLETAAEIKFLKQIGCHVVGQTLQHEFGLWRKLGLHVGHLWIASNFAESGGVWIENKDYRPEDWDQFYSDCAVPCGNVVVDAVLAATSQEDLANCRCQEFAGGSAGMSKFPVDFPANWPTK